MNHVHEPLSVYAIFDPEKGLIPTRLVWNKRDYKVSEISIHFTKMIDGALQHIYGIITDGAIFEISFNSKTLLWKVEQVQDSEFSA
ncbi:MAG: hypothetical protein M1444_01210 [Patescibacteria group bacterium]|nr:hypothetical protein [Patescibacteria group bacterium]